MLGTKIMIGEGCYGVYGRKRNSIWNLAGKLGQLGGIVGKRLSNRKCNGGRGLESYRLNKAYFSIARGNGWRGNGGYTPWFWNKGSSLFLSYLLNHMRSTQDSNGPLWWRSKWTSRVEGATRLDGRKWNQQPKWEMEHQDIRISV